MDNRNLKRMSKTEVLELLIDQVKENEKLRADLEKISGELEDKKRIIRELSIISESALRISGLMGMSAAERDPEKNEDREDSEPPAGNAEEKE